MVDQLYPVINEADETIWEYNLMEPWDLFFSDDGKKIFIRDSPLVRKLKNDICKQKLNIYCLEQELKKTSKLKIKLKMMEISFEIINNARNKLMYQLAKCELILEKLKK